MQVYIDESKSKAYVIVAVLIAPGKAAGIRKRMNLLRMPRQGHIHFVNEGPARRKQILTEIQDMGIRARVYKVSGLSSITARAVCLDALIEELNLVSATHLVIERDDSAVKTDVFILRRGLQRQGLSHRVEYKHLGKSEEPLLWVADAIAWSYARGGDFKRRAMALIDNVNDLTA